MDPIEPLISSTITAPIGQDKSLSEIMQEKLNITIPGRSESSDSPEENPWADCPPSPLSQKYIDSVYRPSEVETNEVETPHTPTDSPTTELPTHPTSQFWESSFHTHAESTNADTTSKYSTSPTPSSEVPSVPVKLIGKKAESPLASQDKSKALSKNNLSPDSKENPGPYSGFSSPVQSDGSDGGRNITPEPSPHQDPERFEYNRFLEQMRHKNAAPVARYLKSFLRDFGRKPLSVNEQIRTIHEFLDSISLKMQGCELWHNATEKEFENATEGMEKLVMNRLYKYAFCPVTTDDAEKDEVLSQRIQLYRWVREEHLDIPANSHNDSFLQFAQAGRHFPAHPALANTNSTMNLELLKMNHYKAPRDKLICILNCCIIIFDILFITCCYLAKPNTSIFNSDLRLLKHLNTDTSADRFLPVLILVVIRANPSKLISNVQYISRFRNPDKLQSEAGYYLTNLMGAISFIESMDCKSLSISEDEFNRYIDQTVEEISPRQSLPEPLSRSLSCDTSMNAVSTPNQKNPRHSLEPSSKSHSLRQSTRPASIISRFLSDIESEDAVTIKTPSRSQPMSTRPTSYSLPRSGDKPSISSLREARDLNNLSSPLSARKRSSTVGPTYPTTPLRKSPTSERTPGSSVDYSKALAILKDMFTSIDPETCESILHANKGHLQPSIEALLDISTKNMVASNTEMNQYH
ncbi:hypothetical protein K493DRAFT_334882 [Basidiobolus meristosporus CBS 931.73]|uniref:VPS9 domain-containing protein n=1 Tax=Basidiobolus meristosporus CBS 931.73 TaxID=1314790 RepID=A0A1Y1YUR8_9FUNG|nr:hypothetical protein K493DRAFT_334882 [Basidiobolus meristosporus CBS 931.73]|eukprot:ORY01719.1 hypothetical protein K493DRAFT_334882 [Basidiobolus meristosporus CBS 931.73]